MIERVVPGVHRQSCTDDGCTGCFRAPEQFTATPARTPGPRRNARGESPDQARTRRNREAIEKGRHPVAGVALLREGGHTCGDCSHAMQTSGGARWFWKCDTMPRTGGPGTDLRVSWPACVRFEERVVEQRPGASS